MSTAEKEQATTEATTEAPKEEPKQPVAVIEPPKGVIELTDRGISFGNFEGMWRWAGCIHRSGLAPKGMNQEALVVAMVMGRGVGLDPFQAIQNIAVINNRPMMFGDAPLAICRQHTEWDEDGFEEWWEVDGQHLPPGKEPTPADLKKGQTAYVCGTKRKSRKQTMYRRFCVDDAMMAKLWGKEGPWTFYPKRMLMFRARGYCLRDNFGDALKGLGIKELYDEDQLRDVTPAEPPTGRVRVADLKPVNGAVTSTPSAPPVEPQPATETTTNTPPTEASQQPPQPEREPGDEPEDLDAQDRAAWIAAFEPKIAAANDTATTMELSNELDKQSDYLGHMEYTRLQDKITSREVEIKKNRAKRGAAAV